MSMTDPIADMLTRIRNALIARNDRASMPLSRMKLDICKILKEEGFIKNFRITREKGGPTLTVLLKYGPKGERVLTGLARVSKPGLRAYVGKNKMPRVLSGLGVAILSTPQGVMAGEEARRRGLGGEVICKVW